MSSKDKKNFPWTVLIIGTVILGGLFMILNAGEKEGNTATTSGKLTVSEKNWNIGSVSMKDGLNYKTIELINETDTPVIVTEMQTSCMCTTAYIVNEDGTKGPQKGMLGHGVTSKMSQTIAAGEVATLTIVYDPNAHGPNAVGPITRNVTLKTDSLEQSTINLKFSGLVTK